MTKMDKQYIEKEYEQAIKSKQSTTPILKYGRGTLLRFYRKKLSQTTLYFLILEWTIEPMRE